MTNVLSHRELLRRVFCVIGQLRRMRAQGLRAITRDPGSMVWRRLRQKTQPISRETSPHLVMAQTAVESRHVAQCCDPLHLGPVVEFAPSSSRYDEPSAYSGRRP